MEHLRGSECDVRIRSRGETSGTIVTPNFPGSAPPHITCVFYIDGLVDTQNLEKVMLTFDSAHLPGTSSRYVDCIQRELMRLLLVTVETGIQKLNRLDTLWVSEKLPATSKFQSAIDAYYKPLPNSLVKAAEYGMRSVHHQCILLH